MSLWWNASQFVSLISIQEQEEEKKKKMTHQEIN